MSKRTREQQDAHNRRRREMKQLGRQGVFTMNYIQIIHPEIYNEVSKFHGELKEKYPKKLNLTKTYEFKRLGNKPTKNIITLEPQLNISLLSTGNQATTSNIKVTEAPPVNIEILEADEIEKIIQELRNDPDLMSTFNDITIEDPVDEITVETTPAEASSPNDNEEIDKIVTEICQDAEFMKAFDHLGEDLSELDEHILVRQKHCKY